MSHSYGTVLAAGYNEQHPEKVAKYVSIAQVVSMDTSNQIMVEHALVKATQRGEDVTALNEAYNTYLNNSCVSATGFVYALV